MKKNLRQLVLLVFAVAALLTACKKGDIGPKGDKGDPGASGAKGDKGVTGAQGPAGNANVFSKTFDWNKITWTHLTEYGTNYTIADLKIPQITADIVNSGGVFVYGSLFFGGQQWTAFPTSYLEFGVTRHFTFSINAGNVRVRYSKSDNTFPSSTIAIKVVFMTGKAVALAGQNGVNLNNYNHVKTAFHLND
ncbi:collagen-like triple helix repeat-containing protein [Niabella beijingensis]|uniref:collagen-like triple helix repeat-containing protein n=1 Tax=Niabella beijingensis TaxID=2872700 RepID=UPI001CBF746D|nr:collagen-like protein [Niabella beijingensis]MBZ4189860.1 collagen-like protein [Niabella beijingensis]